MSESDERFMRMALALGERALGRAWPNPAVGCVLVKGGRVVGRGWTGDGGRPHAETEALARAGAAARGATVYVTLEPCAHHGRTPPCSAALLDAGVARVVVAMLDPDPRVDGRGIAALRAGGVAVEVGCLASEARRAHAGFVLRLAARRPLIVLKAAVSLDGRIAAASGAARWVTGERARAWAHLLRSEHDAVLVGSGTALADDPMLDCRLPGLAGRSPVRVVLDRRLRLPPTGRLASSAASLPVWVLTARPADAPEAAALTARGVTVLSVAPADPDWLPRALAMLAERGITRLLVEGGAQVATALWRAALVDRLVLLQAPLVLGGDAVPLVAGLGLAEPGAAPRWRVIEEGRLGDDRLVVLEPA